MEEECASNSTNTMVGDIDEGDQLLPHPQSSPYVLTPVLQPEATFTYGGIFEDELGPGSSLDATALPLDFFLLVWGNDTFPYVAEQTNLYALQKGKEDWSTTKDREMMSFVGILLAMGKHRLLSLRDYRSQHALLGVPGITSGMSRNRFLELLSNLHLNDNDIIPARDSPLFDKLY